jgi:putative inorganic carbon (HCO3(-)) transporter
MLARGKALLTYRFTWLYLLILFPFIDYTLRKIIPIPVVSSLWDEGLLFLLVLIAVWRAVETNRPLPDVKRPLLAFTVMGVAYFVFNMNHFWVNIEGFRAVFQYILAFFVGYYIFHSTSEAKKAIRLFVVGGGLVALYGVIQYILGVEVPASWVDASESVRTRSFSIVQSPNILGSYMVLASPIAFGLALASKGRQRWLWIGVGMIMLAALVFTGSRGAWLAFAGALGLISMLIDRRVFIGFMIIALLSAFFVPQVNSRLTHLFSADYLMKSSNDGRIARWMNSYDIMRNQPFYGAGLGRYGGAVGERNFGTTYVDSYYFKTLAETGLLGISLYLWIMYSISLSGYRIWKREKGHANYYIYGGILAGLLGVMLHNGVENIFEVPFMNTFFWLLAGLMLSLPYMKKNDEEGGASLA